MKYFFAIIIGVVLGFILYSLMNRIASKRYYAKRRKGIQESRKERIKPNFTKLILSFILATYFIGLGLGVYVTLKDFSQYGILATFIATPTTTVIALYCWKAKAENIIKIKQGYPEETKDIPIDLNNIQI